MNIYKIGIIYLLGALSCVRTQASEDRKDQGRGQKRLSFQTLWHGGKKPRKTSPPLQLQFHPYKLTPKPTPKPNTPKLPKSLEDDLMGGDEEERDISKDGFEIASQQGLPFGDGDNSDDYNPFQSSATLSKSKRKKASNKKSGKNAHRASLTQTQASTSESRTSTTTATPVASSPPTTPPPAANQVQAVPRTGPQVTQSDNPPGQRSFPGLPPSTSSSYGEYLRNFGIILKGNSSAPPMTPPPPSDSQAPRPGMMPLNLGNGAPVIIPPNPMTGQLPVVGVPLCLPSTPSVPGGKVYPVPLIPVTTSMTTTTTTTTTTSTSSSKLSLSNLLQPQTSYRSSFPSTATSVFGTQGNPIILDQPVRSFPISQMTMSNGGQPSTSFSSSGPFSIPTSSSSFSSSSSAQPQNIQPSATYTASGLTSTTIAPTLGSPQNDWEKMICGYITQFPLKDYQEIFYIICKDHSSLNKVIASTHVSGIQHLQNAQHLYYSRNGWLSPPDAQGNAAVNRQKLFVDMLRGKPDDLQRFDWVASIIQHIKTWEISGMPTDLSERIAFYAKLLLTSRTLKEACENQWSPMPTIVEVSIQTMIELLDARDRLTEVTFRDSKKSG